LVPNGFDYVANVSDGQEMKKAGRRPSKSKSDDLTETDVLSWMESGRLDHTAAYLARGRSHANLTDSELSEAWQRTMIAMAEDPFSAEIREREQDLGAEIDLRGSQRPCDLVKEAIEEYISKIDKAHEDLKNDPEEYQRSNEEIIRDISKFKQSRDRSTN
jgi:hypothetical protein